jgi:peptidoglycan/xylan/chitin deacetylase (PgdA/CDA1 family)
MYTLVLTHDIDYLSLKEIPWSCKTLWGFSYRCLKAAVSFSQFRYSIGQRVELLWNGISMPLVKFGLRDDPWESSLDSIIEMEKRLGVKSTFFFLPFPNLPGITPAGQVAPANRSAFYKVTDYKERIQSLELEGWEIGVHGIDAYRIESSAVREKMEIEGILGHNDIGIRMHWLYTSVAETWQILARAGYRYDSTLGWNEEVGFPDGHFTPFRPFKDQPFTLLPLNIQDQALFEGLKLSDDAAWEKICVILSEAKTHDGVVTVLWHNYSFITPMLWGSTYERIIRQAQADGAQILRAIDAVNNEYAVTKDYEEATKDYEEA